MARARNVSTGSPGIRGYNGQKLHGRAAGGRHTQPSAIRAARERCPGPGRIILTSDDIDASHAHLQASGVDVDAEVARMGDPVPPMFWFRDPDGNSLMIVQQS